MHDDLAARGVADQHRGSARRGPFAVQQGAQPLGQHLWSQVLVAVRGQTVSREGLHPGRHPVTEVAKRRLPGLRTQSDARDQQESR